MDSLYTHIDRHFLAPDALARAAILARAGPDANGWFKGELAFLLDSLLKANEIRAWRANVPITEEGRQRCDFRIEPAHPDSASAHPEVSKDAGPLWLEVKAIADPARAGPLADSAVFARGSSFTDDIVKLLRVPDGDRAVLLFVYPRPEPAQWTELISAYTRRIAPIAFTEQSDLSAYPPQLYICKLAVSGGFV